jgi:3-hydroxyacyl-[acyl-carrier-protein] dehydratase
MGGRASAADQGFLSGSFRDTKPDSWQEGQQDMSETTPGALDSVDIMRLMEILPHRYPFLLLDKIIDIDGDNSATGIKNVTINEPHFTGHFPGKPIMPGVLIIESMAQTAGAIALIARGLETKALVYFMSIDGAKFRKPVVPGDQLRIYVKKIRRRGNLMKYACEAHVDGTKVAEAEVTAMLVDAQEAHQTHGQAES